MEILFHRSGRGAIAKNQGLRTGVAGSAPCVAKDHLVPRNQYHSNPQNKEKHFLVTKVINPEIQKHLIEEVVMEAVLTQRSFRLRWVELTDEKKWQQGWD